MVSTLQEKEYWPVVLGERLVEQKLELRRTLTEIGLNNNVVQFVIGLGRLNTSVVVKAFYSKTVELESDEHSKRSVPDKVELLHCIRLAFVVIDDHLLGSALHELTHETELLVQLAQEEKNRASCYREERQNKCVVQVCHEAPRGLWLYGSVQQRESISQNRPFVKVLRGILARFRR